MFLRKFNMKIKRIITFIIFIFIGVGFFTYNVVKQMPSSELDVVAVNDIIKTIEKKWHGDITSVGPKGDKYDLDFVVIDNDNILKFSTSRGLHETINEAIKYRDTIIDIKVDKKVVGKAIFYNYENQRLEESRKKLIVIVITSIVLILILCIGYIFYLNQKVINPFESLRAFAGSVAAGNLDIPLEMDKDNIFGAFTESFDIMRDELRKAKESEREANESKKELVASLSHDIKTPLASIKAVTELMQIKTNDEKQKSQLENIGLKADQIELLINNLFTATLEELSVLEIHPKDEESTILYEMVKLPDYNHRIKEFFVPECLIRCDRLRLQQVLDNIITNSYKYANTDISVNMEIVDRFLEVHICDLGDGVSDEELPLILQKFYRGKNSSGQNGSGLGLYISKYFMEKMDGSLELKNLSKGFKVTLYLYLP